MARVTNHPVCPQCNADASADSIWVHSGVNHKAEGFVHIAWAGNLAQLTPQEAREHAYVLLECAEAAESDGMVFKLLTRDIGLDTERAVQVIGSLRRYRDEPKKQGE